LIVRFTNEEGIDMGRLLGMLVVHGLGYFSRSLGSYTFIQIHEGEEIHYAL
jgi:hypothetical protein